MSNIATDPKTQMSRYAPLAILAIGFAFGLYFLGDYLTFDALAENRQALIEFRDANYLATILAFMAVYILIVAFSLPGASAATLTGGFLFGLFPGVLIIVAAATIGAIAIFLAARTGFGASLSARLDDSSGPIRAIKQGIAENELSMLFLIRLVPAVPFFVANLLPAFLGVSLSRYAMTTFFGIMPGTAVYTWVGAGLGEVIAAGESPNLGIIFEWHILGPILGLCLLALLPIVLKSIRGKGNQ